MGEISDDETTATVVAPDLGVRSVRRGCVCALYPCTTTWAGRSDHAASNTDIRRSCSDFHPGSVSFAFSCLSRYLLGHAHT